MIADDDDDEMLVEKKKKISIRTSAAGRTKTKKAYKARKSIKKKHDKKNIKKSTTAKLIRLNHNLSFFFHHCLSTYNRLKLWVQRYHYL